MKIGIASDHRGYPLKGQLIENLTKSGLEIVDFGTNNNISTDYPDYAFRLGEAVAANDVDFGVAICGSGIGISIACNKVKGVRCAKVTTEQEAEITRIDNNANIVAFGEQTSLIDAEKIIKKFVETPFSNLEKHQKRIDKIKRYEETH